MKNWNEVKTELILNDETNKIYFDALDIEFKLIDKLIEVRKEKKVTQIELARKIGTTQAAIAKFESKANVPKLDTFIKVALGLGLSVELNDDKEMQHICNIYNVHFANCNYNRNRFEKVTLKKSEGIRYAM